MKGLLIYLEKDNPNDWYTQNLIRHAKSFDLDINLAVFKRADEAKRYFSNPVDFIINRTRDYSISEAAKERGIVSFNNSRVIKIANNKWETYKLCKELCLPVMQTEKHEQKLKQEVYPLVVKSVDGHGGSEVFLAKSYDEILGIINSHKSKQFIFQQPSTNLGIDIRVYLIGNRPIIAVKRSSKKDFRSNYSLGGQAQIFELTDELKKIADTLQRNLLSDYIAVDFIIHNGAFVVNEIEDVVGSRMVEEVSDIDIVGKYMAYIAEKLF